ncbi:glucosaminidase domain-containing protein [Patiriisocius sp. Uisw_017]|jgi:flagellum-specific peptidoglycan hydrolase FlgJ|uniref:glucosaminidase domain-containing protein n=1 Tax=Patiriisocius sp. Uisw_017 TaxID=3230968 RepID=UPI0039E87ED3
MPTKVFTISILLLLMLATGCKSKKRTVSQSKKPKTEKGVIPKAPLPIKVKNPKKQRGTPTTSKPNNSSYAEVVSNYIKEYSDIAKQEMLQYGIPASIKLAQGILESGAGRGDLSIRAKNHFGIKCHKGWEGESVYHDDDSSQECFRKYVDAKYSYRDHSLFLTKRSRYQDLFSLGKDDYKRWAQGLKKAGYATDPKYPNKLIDIIERYNLQAFDQEVLGNNSIVSKSDDTKIRTYTVKKGDTVYSLSRKFSISVATLKEYNGMTTNDLTIGRSLYLHAVKN